MLLCSSSLSKSLDPIHDDATVHILLHGRVVFDLGRWDSHAVLLIREVGQIGQVLAPTVVVLSELVGIIVMTILRI